MSDRTKWAYVGSNKGGSPLQAGDEHSGCDDDAPLLSRAFEGGDRLKAGEFNLLHANWVTNDDEGDCEKSSEWDEGEEESSYRRASSVKSSLSQEPELQCSQSLSQVLGPSEEKREKLSRGEALNLLRDASSAAEAAQRALEKVSGEDFLDASQEELSVRDDLLNKIKRKLNRLQQEAKKQKWKLRNLDDTFLSRSTYDEFGQLKKDRDEVPLDDPNQKSTPDISVQSRGVQTEAETSETPRRPFRKPFDQLKDVDTQKARSNQIIGQVRDFAETNGITVAQGVGYLLYRHYWGQGSKRLAKFGAQLFLGDNPSLMSEVPPLTCLWLASRNNLSRVRYINLRLQLLKHVRLQPYSFLSELRMSLCPPLHPWPANCDANLQRGLYADLGEAILTVVKRMIQFDSGWLPSCSKGGGQKCANVVATIHVSGDGRGDEKQYGQRSQIPLDTSHVLSFVFSIPSFSLALLPTENISTENLHTQIPLTPSKISSGSEIYFSQAVLPGMKVQHTGFPSRFAQEENGIRVWSLNKELEDSLISREEPSRKRQRVGLDESEGPQNDGGSDCVEDNDDNNPLEQSLMQLAQKIRKPIGFQVKGDVLWRDPEPQSSRAAHPWIISHERETKDNVRALFHKVINPQVSYMVKLSVIWSNCLLFPHIRYVSNPSNMLQNIKLAHRIYANPNSQKKGFLPLPLLLLLLLCHIFYPRFLFSFILF